MLKREFKLGKVTVSPNKPPVFFAEIGSYFNGNGDLAAAMIEKIIKVAKANPAYPMVLKTEILNNPEICLPVETMETYTSKDGRVKHERYRDLIERKAMPIENYARLFRMCTDAEIPFVVSVYDFEAAKYAAEHGAAGLKIASANVTHVPLIRYAAGFGLPLTIDTGRTTLAEVERAVETARKAGCEEIIVQHSPDGHPAPAKAHNLRILETYARIFGVPTGLSDHFVGTEMCYLAIAMGASVVEKGVYDDPEELDQDISHSMDINDLPLALKRVNESWEALGQPVRDKSAAIDWVIGTSQRQCLVAARDLKAGDRVGLETMRFAFPSLGIQVEHWDLVDGWQLTRDVKRDTPIQWTDVAPAPKRQTGG
jgi:sialic acid synthase SpsE